MSYSSTHTSNTIVKRALVIFGVKEINDGKRDQSCKKESHFVSLRAEAVSGRAKAERWFVWASALLCLCGFFAVSLRSFFWQWAAAFTADSPSS
jgi:hypothetical protein